MRKLSVLLVGTSLLGMVACGNGGVSEDCKKLYDEQIDVYQKEANALKIYVESGGEKAPMFGSTAFFHLTPDEKEVWDGCKWDDEMSKNLEKGKKISDDYKLVSDAEPEDSVVSTHLMTQEQIDEYNKNLESYFETVKSIADKYTKDDAFTLKKYKEDKK